MQLATVEVRLSGSRENTVVKDNVTVPEIVLLRAIHGNDSVNNIQPTGMDKRPHAAEYERLKKIYGTAKDEKENLILDKLFPGHNPVFPVTLADIGLEVSGADTEEATTPRKRRTKRVDEIAAPNLEEGGPDPETPEESEE
jgi:hypothetical protein